jgi:hypothetical protein
MTFPLRDRAEADAILTDLYLDSLLAARDRRAVDAPSDAGLDPAVRFAAGRLSADLARVHPSFRFEERLAARLADVAARLRLVAAAGGGMASGAPVGPGPGPALEGGRDPLFDPDLDPAADPATSTLVRPLFIGGAITSAAISLAGAAFVAWRRSRPPLSPMARAVRAAGQARLQRASLHAPRRSRRPTRPRILD